MKIRKPVVGKMAVTAVIVIVAVGVYAVWGSRRSERVHVREMALAENPGLKGILELYQEDSLKYEAALFLIDIWHITKGLTVGSWSPCTRHTIYSARDVTRTGRRWIRRKGCAESPKTCSRYDGKRTWTWNPAFWFPI